MPIAAAEQQIMVDGHVAVRLAERHEHRVIRAFVVRAVIERFAEHGPLHGEVGNVIRVHRSIDGPGGGDVVENHIVTARDVQAVVAPGIFVTQTDAKISNDDIG